MDKKSTVELREEEFSLEKQIEELEKEKRRLKKRLQRVQRKRWFGRW